MDATVFRSMMNDLLNLETALAHLEEMYRKSEKVYLASEMGGCREDLFSLVKRIYEARTYTAPK